MSTSKLDLSHVIAGASVPVVLAVASCIAALSQHPFAFNAAYPVLSVIRHQDWLHLAGNVAAICLLVYVWPPLQGTKSTAIWMLNLLLFPLVYSLLFKSPFVGLSGVLHGVAVASLFLRGVPAIPGGWAAIAATAVLIAKIVLEGAHVVGHGISWESHISGVVSGLLVAAALQISTAEFHALAQNGLARLASSQERN